MALVFAFSLYSGMPVLAQTAPTIVITWNPAALAEVHLGKVGTPIAARALAVAQTGMCEALAPDHVGAFGAVMAPPHSIANAAAQAVSGCWRNDGSNQCGNLHPAADANCTGGVPVNRPMRCRLPTTPDTRPLNISEQDNGQPLIDNGFVQSPAAPHRKIAATFASTSAGHFDGCPDLVAGLICLHSPVLHQDGIGQILNISKTPLALQDRIVEYRVHGRASELPLRRWRLPGHRVTRLDASSIDKDVKMFFTMHTSLSMPTTGPDG